MYLQGIDTGTYGKDILSAFPFDRSWEARNEDRQSDIAVLGTS